MKIVVGKPQVHRTSSSYVESAPAIHRTTYVEPQPVIRKTTYVEGPPIVVKKTYISEPAPVIVKKTYISEPAPVIVKKTRYVDEGEGDYAASGCAGPCGGGSKLVKVIKKTTYTDGGQ